MHIEPVDLAGAWRLEVTISSVAEVPIVGEVHGASVSVLAITMTPDGAGGWTQAQRVCEVRVDGGGPIARTTVPDAFVAALAPRAYAATLSPEDGRWRYRADTGVEAVGFDPATTLPRVADGAVDTDLDGAPGATLHLQVAGLGAEEIYIAQRAHTVLEGWVVTPDRIAGRVDVLSMEQVTLGASNPLLARDNAIRADEGRSSFTMVRVPPGTACDAAAVGEG